MASWKTALCGFMAAGFAYLSQTFADGTMHMVGVYGSMVATAALGFFAKDSNVSHSRVPAKPEAV